MTLNKRIYREKTRYWKHTLFQLMDFLKASRYCDNYIWNDQKIQRAVMHYLHQQLGWPDAGLMVFRMPRLMQPDSVAMSVIQIQRLLVAKFRCFFAEHRLALIIDIVVTGCLTGLQYSDLMAMKWGNLMKTEVEPGSGSKARKQG